MKRRDALRSLSMAGGASLLAAKDPLAHALAPDVAARFGIRGIPTLIAFKGGREVARQSGALDLPGLMGWIKANV